MTDILPAPSPRTPPIQSEVIYRIAHTDYPMRVFPNCDTCNSEFRPEIEHMVLMGFGWKKIAEVLPDFAGLTHAKIQRHWSRGHMPLPEAQRRAVIERRARFKKISTTDADLPLVDPWIVQNAIMQKGFELLMTGQIVPDVKDLISATKEVTNLEQIQAADQILNGESINEIIESARQKMDPEKFMEWCIEMRFNPAMNLYKEQEEITDAEVIEEGDAYTALPPMGDKAERMHVHEAETHDAVPRIVDGAEWL